MRIVVYVIFFALVLISPAEALEERYPVGHPDQGLPHPDFVLSPYHEDPNHVLNRIFKASFLVTIAPAEVGLALPREHRDPKEFFRKPCTSPYGQEHRWTRNSSAVTLVCLAVMGLRQAKQRPLPSFLWRWMARWFELSMAALSWQFFFNTISFE